MHYFLISFLGLLALLIVLEKYYQISSVNNLRK